MITAERSDPPRPSVTSRCPFVARKPGTTTTGTLVRDASSVSAWRSTRSGWAIKPVSCAFNPTAGVPVARNSSVSSATERTSPVDHNRSSSSCSGRVAYRRASSSSASVWPFSAETTTTRRLPPAARRATNVAAWRYPAGPVSTDPPIFKTVDTRPPFRPRAFSKKGAPQARMTGALRPTRLPTNSYRGNAKCCRAGSADLRYLPRYRAGISTWAIAAWLLWRLRA